MRCIFGTAMLTLLASTFAFVIVKTDYSVGSYQLDHAKEFNCTIDALNVISDPCPHIRYVDTDCNRTIFNVSFEVGSSHLLKTFKSSRWTENPYASFKVGQSRSCYLVLAGNGDIEDGYWKIATQKQVQRYLVGVIITTILLVSSILTAIILCVIAYVDDRIKKPSELLRPSKLGDDL